MTGWKYIWSALLHRATINNSVYGAVIMTMVTGSTRVHPVHVMHADWAPGGLQPSGQANRLGLWIHHRHLSLLLSPKANTHFTVPQRVEGWVYLGTAGRVCSPCSRLYIAVTVIMNITAHGLSHLSQSCHHLYIVSASLKLHFLFLFLLISIRKSVCRRCDVMSRCCNMSGYHWCLQSSWSALLVLTY